MIFWLHSDVTGVSGLTFPLTRLRCAAFTSPESPVWHSAACSPVSYSPISSLAELSCRESLIEHQGRRFMQSRRRMSNVSPLLFSLMNNAVLQWEPALAWEALIFQKSREQQEIGDDSSCPGPGAGDMATLLLLWLLPGDFIRCLPGFMLWPEN